MEEGELGASAEAIAFPVPTVQNKQDCPEDSGHWKLRGSDRTFWSVFSSQWSLVGRGSRTPMRMSRKARERIAQYTDRMGSSYGLHSRVAGLKYTQQ